MEKQSSLQTMHYVLWLEDLTKWKLNIGYFLTSSTIKVELLINSGLHTDEWCLIIFEFPQMEATAFQMLID